MRILIYGAGVIGEKSMKNEEYKKLSINEFTKAAGRYESNHAGIYEMCKKDYPDILEELEKEPFRDLLDAGCGPAPMISLLSEKYPDRHYTGLDLTPAMIEQAKKKEIPNATFVVGDCENFPFENDSFDAIICSMSFHHYPDPQAFFDSVKRCLRPNGRLILRDVTSDNKVLVWLMNTLEMPLANICGHGDVRVPTRDVVMKCCRKAGLKVEKFEIRKGMRMHCVVRKPNRRRRQTMKEKVNVTGVPETMVQTLYARAKETKKQNAKIKDEIAVELVEKLDYNFSKADKDKAMNYGVIARTIVLDRMVKQYLEKHANTVVINIACGLDTRCYRMERKYLHWYNVDLSETMKIRSQFLTETGPVYQIAKSAMDESYVDDIDYHGENVLVIIEGLTMYLCEKDIRKMFSIIEKSFQKVTVMVETMSPFVVKHVKEKSIEGSNAKFTWGVKNGKELQRIIPAFSVRQEVSLIEGMKELMPIYHVIGKFPIVRNISNKIIVMEKRG